MTFKELVEAQKIDAVDVFARELASKKKQMNPTVYIKLHKLLMANDVKKAEEGLEFLKRYK